jgi:hypothetical protein
MPALRGQRHHAKIVVRQWNVRCQWHRRDPARVYREDARII